MNGFFTWVLIIICLALAYQAGLFNAIGNYFQRTSDMSRQEQVIENPDGSTTTIKYKNVLNMWTDRRNGQE